jgi:hypothetical protein
MKKTVKKTKKPYVIIRTYSAGVHVGILESKKDKEVILSDARRIWRWYGANTLSEISLHGIDIQQSKVSEQVKLITLTEAIEIIECTKESEKILRESKWNQ